MASQSQARRRDRSGGWAPFSCNSGHPKGFPPEGCVNPMDFIDLITRIMKLDKNKKGTDSFSGVIVQKVDEDGNIETIDI
jgi:hypothetical protein